MIISSVRRARVWWQGFNVQLVLLSRETGSVSSGNLSPLTSLAAQPRKMQATILLPLETTKVAGANTVIFVTEAPSRLTYLIIVAALNLSLNRTKFFTQWKLVQHNAIILHRQKHFLTVRRKWKYTVHRSPDTVKPGQLCIGTYFLESKKRKASVLTSFRTGRWGALRNDDGVVEDDAQRRVV